MGPVPFAEWLHLTQGQDAVSEMLHAHTRDAGAPVSDAPLTSPSAGVNHSAVSSSVLCCRALGLFPPPPPPPLRPPPVCSGFWWAGGNKHAQLIAKAEIHPCIVKTLYALFNVGGVSEAR